MSGSRLRIGLVCPYSFDSPGGVQNHVLGLARHLISRGHQPEVLAPGELGAAAQVLSPELFTSAGATVPVRYNGSVARVSFGPLSAARVRRWLRSRSFDLLHLHEPITPSISILALWAADVPVVATFHTATPRSRSMQLAGGAMQASIEKIGAGIAVSESARNVVVQHLGRDAVVIPNGFSWADFAAPSPTPDPAPGLAPGLAPAQAGSPPPRRWRGGGARRLVFLGRLDEPRKGLEVLIAALPLIRSQCPDVHVVVAGQGSHALPAGCETLGSISDLHKARLLGGASVFVAPHLERESFGIVLLEAMASGAPVVASDLAPFADLLGGGARARGAELGGLFTTGDPADLARAVVQVLDHPDLERLRRARQAARRYDWSVVGPEVTAVYRATLAVADPGRSRGHAS